MARIWEVGDGIYTTSGTTLSRANVYASSNAGALVNFGAGTKNVFVTEAARSIANVGLSMAFHLVWVPW